MPGLGFDINLELELQDTIESFMDADSFLEMALIFQNHLNDIDEGVLTDERKFNVWLSNELYSLVSAWRKTYDA